MERYLLFDAGCSVCHHLAHAIEEAAAGKLKARSIRDPQVREWLDRAYPAGWEHQPYLVTGGGGGGGGVRGHREGVAAGVAAGAAPGVARVEPGAAVRGGLAGGGF